MARVLEEFPAVTRDGKYDWSQWGDGRVWELEEGVDFDTKISSIRQTAAKAAARLGKSLRTTTQSRGSKTFLVLQFTDPGKRSGKGKRAA